MHLLTACHPSPASLCARVTDLIATTLAAGQRGITVDHLGERGFDPVLSRQELESYLDDRIPADIAALVAHLRSAEHLIFVFPVWMYDMPALLKGYFDRVWRPHVSFSMQGDKITPLLTGVKRLSVIATHGRNKTSTDRSGDSSRLFFSQSLPSVLPNLEQNTRFDLYDLDAADEQEIGRELARIEWHFSAA